MSIWPGRDRAEADPEARPLDRERPHHVLDRGAGGARVDHPRHPVVRGEGDADDLAALLRDERLGRDGVGHVPGALDVQLGDRAEALGRDRLGRGEELPAGVVDEQVDPPVALERRRRPSPRPPPRRGCRRRRASALPPTASTAACVSSSGSSRRPQPTTVAPSRASSRAVSRPIPLPAPETRQTMPVEQAGSEDPRGLGGHGGEPMRALVRAASALAGTRTAAGSLEPPMSKLKAEAKPLAEPLPGAPSTGATVDRRAAARRRDPGPARLLREQGRAARGRCGCSASARRARAGCWIPVPAYLITHPTAGPILVDTAFHGSVAAKPSANLGRLIGALRRARGSSRAATSPRSSASAGSTRSELKTRGPDPPALRPHAPASPSTRTRPSSLSKREWEAATTDTRPFLRGYRPAHYDYLFDYRTVDFDGPGISSYASFGRTFDLFGDGSVRLAFTPGHSAGPLLGDRPPARPRPRDRRRRDLHPGAARGRRPAAAPGRHAQLAAARCASCSSSPAPTRRR